ncbi:spermidine synthase [Barrientosiimonas marina]|uniref:Spermine/spermidine synthase n=2 Tax=Lentibacillus kimchii TaxID=1542911 RepID=A0ABW2UW07_9BACI
METSVHVLDRVQTPRGELQLQRRGSHYEIINNGIFLMATYNGESEKYLVRQALASVASPKRVVIGGLGVGFSLAEALRDSSVTEVVVIEIENKIIEWNRTYLSAFSEASLEDPRTRVIHDDMLEWMKKETGQFDVICLDIDNGPDWTVTEHNHDMYQPDSLRQLASLMRPGGAVSFWSASSSPDFYQLLKRVFHHVTAWKVSQNKGDDDCIYIASLA